MEIVVILLRQLKSGRSFHRNQVAVRLAVTVGGGLTHPAWGCFGGRGGGPQMNHFGAMDRRRWAEVCSEARLVSRAPAPAERRRLQSMAG